MSRHVPLRISEELGPEECGRAAAKAIEDKILELGPETVAAFIGEPVQGAGGVIVPPASYWPEVQRICRQHDILLIADEVICGFGLTGQWFGRDSCAIAPDLMTLDRESAGEGMRVAESVVSGGAAI